LPLKPCWNQPQFTTWFLAAMVKMSCCTSTRSARGFWSALMMLPMFEPMNDSGCVA